MELSKEFEKKITDVSDNMAHVVQKVKDLGDKVDAVDFANIKEQADLAAKGFEELQKLELKKSAEENKVRMLAIEKAITASMSKEDRGTKQEHKDSFYNYLAHGAPISDETLKAYCEATAIKTLISGDIDKLKAYTKTLIAGSNADGGFYITPERSSAIVDRIWETSPIRSLASVVTTSSNVFEMIIDDDEASCGWVGEVDERPVTNTPEVGLLSIPIHAIFAKPEATQDMLDDAGFDVEGWLQGKVTDKFSRTENTAFVSGNGSKKPKGFLSYPDYDSAGVYQRDCVEQIDGTTAGVLTQPNDVIDLQNSLHDAYQGGAVFGGTRDTFADIMKMREATTTTGAFLLNPYMLKEGTDRVVLAKRFVIMADMPQVATVSLSLVYGDFNKGYTIVDRFGIRVLRDPYVHKPYIQFYSTKRLGGAVTNFEALKLLKTLTT